MRDIRHEGANSRVTRRTFYAALVMTDGTERCCGEERPASKRHEGHNTIKTAIACGTTAARRIGYIARNGEATEGTETAK